MKKRPYLVVLGLILGLVLLFSIVNVSFAENGENGENGDNGGGFFKIKNPLEYTEIDQIIMAIAGFVFQIALILAPLMLIIAGFLFVTSMGEPEKIKKARDLALHTIIGLIIVLLARGLVALIAEILTSNNNT